MDKPTSDLLTIRAMGLGAEGQMTAAQWEQHCSDTPGLKEAWERDARNPGRTGAALAKAEREIAADVGGWSLIEGGSNDPIMIMCSGYPVAYVTCGEWADEYPAIRLMEHEGGTKAEAYMERIVYGSVDRHVALANARLIAAAPDLLAGAKLALKTILDEAETRGYEPPADTLLVAELEHAIALAEWRPAPPTGDAP